MTATRWLRPIAATLGGGIFAGAVQWWRRPTAPDACVDATVPAAPAVQVERAPALATPLAEVELAPDPAVADAEATRRQLLLEIALLRGQLSGFEGEPSPWRPELPDTLRPDALEPALRTAIASAAGVVQALDCSEYPCIAIFDLGERTDGPTPCLEVVEAAGGTGVDSLYLALEQRRAAGGEPGMRCIVAPGLTDDRDDPGLRLRTEHRVERQQRALRGLR